MWTCPACLSVLEQSENNWQCENGHHYDQAKEGYLNLLLAHQKRSKEPGDNKQMINARRSFLEQDYYQPMADALVNSIDTTLCNNKLQLFDAGCGEGYYLAYLHKQMIAKGRDVHSSGVDISKVAILKAAKKYKSSSFAVASTFALPIEACSVDAIIQVFAPSSEKEIRRCLSFGGIWLQVNPGEQHLQEIKALIYSEVQTHNINQTVAEGFELISDQSLKFNFSLASPQSQLDLLMMTPYYWSASIETLEKLRAPIEKVTAHFHIKVLRKTSETEDE
jgi:23S rRNA (guanine745-N1)-methyltransferase